MPRTNYFKGEEKPNNKLTKTNGNGAYQEPDIDLSNLTQKSDGIGNAIALLEQTTGIGKADLVQKILTEALGASETFPLIRLYRQILKESRLVEQEQKLKAIQEQRNQKLIEMRELELKALAHSLF